MNALTKYLEAARKDEDAVDWHGRGCHVTRYRGALDDPRKLSLLARDTLVNHKNIMRFLWQTLTDVFGIERLTISMYHESGRSKLSPKEIVKIEDVLRDMAGVGTKEFKEEDWL